VSTRTRDRRRQLTHARRAEARRRHRTLLAFSYPRGQVRATVPTRLLDDELLARVEAAADHYADLNGLR